MNTRAWAVLAGGLAVVGCVSEVPGPPQVVDIDPSDGAVNVSRTGPFVISFNENMDRSSIANAVRINRVSDGAPVTVDVDSRCEFPCINDLTFVIEGFSLYPGTVYRLTVIGARDGTGEVMRTAVTSQFVTAR